MAAFGIELTSQSDRFINIDVARGIGIILVIYAHALEMSFFGKTPLTDTAFRQWQFIYSFHIPFFFIISGTVFRKKSARDVIAGSLALLLVAISTHIVGWFVNAVFDSTNTTLRALIDPIVRATGFNTVVVWFLVALAFIQPIYHMILSINIHERIATAFLLIGIFVRSEATGCNYYQMMSWLPGLIFYSFGHWLERSGKMHTVLWNQWTCIVVATTIAAMTSIIVPLNRGCLLNPVKLCANVNGTFAVWMIAGQIGFLPVFFLTAILGSCAVLLFANVIASRGGRASRWLSRIGKETLELLIINGFVIVFIQPKLWNIIPEAAPSWVGITWAIGLSIVQIALLPVWRIVIRPIIILSKKLAVILVNFVIQRILRTSGVEMSIKQREKV